LFHPMMVRVAKGAVPLRGVRTAPDS
jgi:hypothetical protein